MTCFKIRLYPLESYYFYINIFLAFRAEILQFKLQCLECVTFKQTLRVASSDKVGESHVISLVIGGELKKTSHAFLVQ